MTTKPLCGAGKFISLICYARTELSGGFAAWLRNTPEGDRLAEQWRDDPPVPAGLA